MSCYLTRRDNDEFEIWGNSFRAIEVAVSGAIRAMTEWEAHMLSRICAGESLFFPDDARLKIQQLFQTLDSRKSGKLQSIDFQDSLPSMHQKKQQLWTTLRSVIDFDGNGVIEPNEFLGYFLLRGLRSDFTPQAANLADSIIHARQSFINNVGAAIQEFEAFLQS